MSEEGGRDESALALSVQVRDLPALRAACMPYVGPAKAISAPFERLQHFVTKAGIGPAGPLLCSFACLTDNIPGQSQQGGHIEALLMVPTTRLIEDCDEDIDTRRLPSQRAACLLYSGPMDSSFRQRHLELFSWLDAAKLNRDGTAHQHAYLSREKHSGHWTIEIRVPILTQNSSKPAL